MPLPALLLACTVCASPAAAPPADTTSNTQSVDISASVDARTGGASLGVGPTFASVKEWRFEPRIGVRPMPALEISVGVPLLVRDLELPAGPMSGAVAGDIDLAADGTLLDKREGEVRHNVMVRGLVKFPSAPVMTDAAGDYLPSALQPGCASIVPGLAGSYAVAWDRWMFETSLGLLLPFSVLEGPHRGASVNQVGRFEVRPVETLGLSLGWRWYAEVTGENAEGEAEQSSGGLVGYAATAVSVDVPGLFTAAVGVDIPAVTALRGEQDPGFIAFARVGGTWETGSASTKQVASLR